MRRAFIWFGGTPDVRYYRGMESYRSLHVWQRAHSLVITALQETDRARHPKTWAVFDQMRRAAVSVEANIVEGYALRAPRQFRRHLRIAVGSAAEAECLARSAGELGYLPQSVVQELAALTNSTIGLLLGLLRKSMSTQT
jgi:four helix bundle protein